jgi:hypothetical protein
MEKSKIYLDDIRTPTEEGWTVCRSYDEFVKAVDDIGLENIEAISLDHDLGDTAIREYFKNTSKNYIIDYNNIHEKTGYDCAKWIVNKSIEEAINLPPITVHSANPVGAANIMGYINNYLKNVRLPQTCVRTKIPHNA